MEIFSKRNNKERGIQSVRRFGYRGSDEEGIALIKDGTRVRLHQQIKYFCSSLNYVERYMMVHDENRDAFSLYSKLIIDFSMREAGYNLSEYLKIDTLEFCNKKLDDSKFFDFIEMLLIFAKEDKRNELVSRFNKIFKEESEPFIIHSFMIIETEQSGLRSALPLIKDILLQKSIREYYRNNIHGTEYEILAKISASILQRLTTSPVSRGKTKDYAEELCEAVAKKWTDQKNVKELKQLLNETIKNSKDLSNQVTNIRHSDQTTIPVDSPKIYKLIATKNINIAELIILTLPERYISEQNPFELKKTYIEDYNINTGASWRYEKKQVKVKEDEEINLEDIPF